MNRMKIFLIGLIGAMLACLPAGAAQAATGTSIPVTGTIQGITFSTDPVTSITTVLVTYQDDANQAQEARISLETAIALELVIPVAEKIGLNIEIADPANPTVLLTSGQVTSLLFTTDPLTGITSLEVSLTDPLTGEQVASLDLTTAMEMGLVSVNTAMISTPIEIEPDDILESGTYPRVLTLLGTFFGITPGVTFDQLSTYREAGFGYGVIAQACWLANKLGGDASLVDQILQAKKTGDFSAIILPDGTAVSNWGQLRQAAHLEHGQNLGSIVSGRAEDPSSPATTEASTETREHGKGHVNNHRHGNHGNR